MNQREATRVKKRQQYVRKACNQCKKRKVKCSGEPCCQQCATHRVRCTYGHVATPSPDSSCEAFHSYEGLEERILKLQSSLDQVLQHIGGSGQDNRTRDVELDDLLLQTTRTIDTFRADLSKNHCSRPRTDDALDSQLLMWDLSATSPSFTTDERQVHDQTAMRQTPPLTFSKDQALELIEYFRFEAECFYPFVPFESMTSLADTLLGSADGAPDHTADIESDNWDDMFDSRNADMLKVLLACAIVSKSKRETEASRRIMSTVLEKLTTKSCGPNLDVKDIAIATLLSVYYLQCDETGLAWRKISTAAKMCQELGLHKSTVGHPHWVTRMFWCIYVLDKRFSFMLNLPFTLQDSEIEHMAPEYDDSLGYISPLINYVRIASRFVPTMPKLGSSYIELEPSTRTSIDIDADQWAHSTFTASAHTYVTGRPTSHTTVEKNQYLRTFITVCRNQLKIGLYKHALFSLSSIAQNTALSHKAVSTASEMIQSCSKLQKSTSMYHLQAVHFNFFVLSAVAALYLAVRHAPLEFGDTPKEIFMGLDILRPYCSSGRLYERVQALEKAMRRLGYDGMRIGPQLTVNDIPRNESLYMREGGRAEEVDGNKELATFIPQLGSFSSLQPHAQEIEQCNAEWPTDSFTATPNQWHTWEDQDWII